MCPSVPIAFEGQRPDPGFRQVVLWSSKWELGRRACPARQSRRRIVTPWKTRGAPADRGISHGWTSWTSGSGAHRSRRWFGLQYTDVRISLEPKRRVRIFCRVSQRAVTDGLDAAHYVPLGATITKTLKSSLLWDRSASKAVGFAQRLLGSYTKHTKVSQSGCAR